MIVEADLVQDQRFNSAEVIRSRQMGNPSYLTQEEFAAVRALMSARSIRDAGWPPAA